jgi:outer membrane receptor for ferrienterochelin and colicin
VAPTESVFDGHIDTVQARVDTDAGRFGLLSAGYELERETYVDASGNQGAAPESQVRLEQYNQALFFEDRLQFFDRRLTVTLGGRAQGFSLQEPSFSGATSPYADIEVATPGAWTGDAALAWFFAGSGTKLRAHVGNSYRSPSAYERFGGSFSSFSGSFSYWGDPRLAPERSVAMDAGIDQWLAGSRVQLSGTIFYTDLREIIVFDFANFPSTGDPFGRFGGYRNSSGGIARGVELGVQTAPSASTRIRAAYTFTNSDSRTPTIGPDFHEIPGQSGHTLTLTAMQWIGDRFNVAFDLFAVSDYSLSPFGAGGRRMVFDGPVRGDAVFRFTEPLDETRNMEFYTKVENILNARSYEDGFLGPGLWAIGGVRLTY